eukprot:1503431-Pleurochrysis_carterae.AAC.6
MFSLFTKEGRDYQLYVESESELKLWSSALPMWSGGEHGAHKHVEALREELSSLKRQIKVPRQHMTPPTLSESLFRDFSHPLAFYRLENLYSLLNLLNGRSFAL